MGGGEGLSFGRLLRGYRETAGLTQEELAEQAGLSANAISALERGVRRHPQPHTVRQLAAALGLVEHQRAALLAAARPAGGPSSLASPHLSLPAPVTPLVGRAQQIAEVCRVLDEARLVTLTGVGGTGKTRLALAVAAASRPAFPGGTGFVDLASVDDPSLVPVTIERSLGADQVGGSTSAKRIARLLGDCAVLLILDNFEQVLEAGPVISELLAEAPGLRALVTSRTLLHLYGEHEYRVPPLALPTGDQLVGESEAVRLFVQAARAARSDFALTDATAAAVAAICARLDGLPLAIELAAARTRLFTPDQLLARLDGRLSVLTGERRDVPSRQQTLRQTFDWSYSLLAPAERSLLAKLGVFAGGFTPTAAAEVCLDDASPDDGLAGLERLHESGLIERVEGSEDEPRFRMLETVRGYALARLAEQGETEAAARRHAAFYLALAEAAAPELLGRNQAAWLGRLEQEYANVLAALASACEWEDAETALRLAAVLWRYWERRNRPDEGRHWLDAALALSPETEEARQAWKHALFGAGVLAIRRNDFVAARKYLTELLPHLVPADTPPSIAAARTQLGNVCLSLGDYAAAQAHYCEALRLARPGTEQRAITFATVGLGDVAFARQDYAHAQRWYDEVERHVRAWGDWYELVRVLRALGRVAAARGEPRRAEGLYEEALGLSRHLHNKTGSAIALMGLGALARSRDEWERARDYYQASLIDYRRASGQSIGMAECLEGLGGTLVALGRAAEGVRLLGAAGTWRAMRQAPMRPADRPAYEQALAAARVALGEQEFAAAHAAGQALNLDHAIDEALEDSTSHICG